MVDIIKYHIMISVKNATKNLTIGLKNIIRKKKKGAEMSNIYLKQMQKLGLNTQQYARLIDIPYEVAKDFIYNKEGDYKMGLRDLLRKNMVERHQDIEENYDNAKLKALEIKQNEIDYVEWYDREYHFDVLKDTLKDVKTIIDFENKYHITVRGTKASHWFYSCLTSKMNYKKRNISESALSEFAEQLYDIIVNKNIEKYRETNSDCNADDLFYINWFDNYDFEKFLEETNHTKHDLAKMMGIGYSTICLMCQKKYRAIKRIKQLYNIINNYEKETLRNNIRQAQINGETDKIEELKKEYNENVEEDDNNATTKITLQNITIAPPDNMPQTFTKLEPETLVNFKENEENPLYLNIEPEKPSIEPLCNNNDELLRKLLINRLTNEEKELIRIFGGKVE